MSPKGSIRAEHIWKRFRADRRGNLLRAEIVRVAAKMRGNGGRAHWRWALRDIDLNVSPGDSVGLIGPNGSGKTTLLKILSRVMHPYAGRLDVQGRVGALIEIRAGIHPELTGRENVYLFGSLLGLSRKEIARRFDQIITFAELEDAVDRQAKFYSSGMQMRLGFSVAAFLEPDVLLVDEVLAVDDATFQQRCLDRMREVIAEGTTVVYVSHDLASVEATCTRGVWLSNGTVQVQGPVHEVLEAYRASVEEYSLLASPESRYLRVLGAEIGAADGGIAKSHESLDLRLELEGLEDLPRGMQHLFLGVSEGTAMPVFVVRHDVKLRTGHQEVRCRIRALPLPKGHFTLWLGLFGREGGAILPWHPVRGFDVLGKALDLAPRAIVRPVPVAVEADWDYIGNGRSTTGDFHGLMPETVASVEEQ